MSRLIIEQRMETYKAKSNLEEANAFKEIIQEITLFALSRTDFFKKASFMGGTALRILYGLPRFSEDLDFSATEQQQDFKWKKYLAELLIEFEAYGLEVEIRDRSDLPNPIKKAFLKQNSFAKLLSLKYERNKSISPVANIRLEIDTQPPEGWRRNTKYVDFPLPYSVLAFDLSTMFAGKINALLTRKFTKGRDWFDFIWYLNQKIDINFIFLQNSLAQFNWDLPSENIDLHWVKRTLKEKIEEIDWTKAKEDVEFLLREIDQSTLKHWNADFFYHYLDKLL